jgi:hypothetical protein
VEVKNELLPIIDAAVVILTGLFFFFFTRRKVEKRVRRSLLGPSPARNAANGLLFLIRRSFIMSLA